MKPKTLQNFEKGTEMEKVKTQHGLYFEKKLLEVLMKAILITSGSSLYNLCSVDVEIYVEIS